MHTQSTRFIDMAGEFKKKREANSKPTESVA